MKEVGPGLTCLACGSDELDVVDSRASGTEIRRRRKCRICQLRQTTYESHRDDGEEKNIAEFAQLYGSMKVLSPAVYVALLAFVARLVKEATAVEKPKHEEPHDAG